jgi:hypothetical protein
MKIIYTPAAREEMNAFTTAAVNDLQEAIRAKKEVLGDEVLEITASDVKEAAHGYGAKDRTARKLTVVQLGSNLYIIFGLAVAFYGVFYKEITIALRENSFQVGLVGSGVCFAILGVVMRTYFLSRLREREFERAKLRRIEEQAKSRNIDKG